MNSNCGISAQTSRLLHSDITNKYVNSIKGSQKFDALAGKVNMESCVARNGTFIYSDIVAKCMNSIQGNQAINPLDGKVDLVSIYNSYNRLSALDVCKIRNVIVK